MIVCLHVDSASPNPQYRRRATLIILAIFVIT